MRLRPITADDVDDLVALDSDPEVMRYLTGGEATPRETIVERSLPRFTRHYPGIAAVGYWAAETVSDGEFLGWFEFRPLDDDSAEVVELGYRLRRAAWGRGFATEGARALIRWGFLELGVQRVTADTMSVNAKSRRVMEKAGLVFHRSYFEHDPGSIPGAEHGEVEYVLDRADWVA